MYNKEFCRKGATINILFKILSKNRIYRSFATNMLVLYTFIHSKQGIRMLFNFFLLKELKQLAAICMLTNNKILRKTFQRVHSELFMVHFRGNFLGQICVHEQDLTSTAL